MSEQEPDPLDAADASLPPRAARNALAGIRAAARDPVIGILILAGIFDALSGNPLHSLILFAAAVALMGEAAGSRATARPVPERAPGTRRFAGALRPATVGAAALYALVAGTFSRYSWPASLAVLLPAAAGLAWTWRPGAAALPARAAQPTPAGRAAWAVVLVVGGLWELTNLLLQPSLETDSYAHPTLSVLTDPLLASHAGRTLALFVWLAAGLWLVDQ